MNSVNFFLCHHKKALYCIFLLAFGLICSSLFAATLDTDQIQIPKENGWVEEKSAAKDSVSETKKRLIINIKDAHCNYSAQKNLYHILDHLVKTYGIKLVGVEGSTGYCNLSYLRDTPKEKRLKVAEEFLKKGELSGEEYFDLVSDADILIWGIEDYRLYQKNIDSFYAVDKVKEGFLSCLKPYKALIDSLKPKIYPQDLAEFENKVQGYYDFNLSSQDFFSYLADFTAKNQVSVSGLRQFDKYSYRVKKSKQIDFAKAQTQMNDLLNQLSQKADDASYQKLRQLSEAYKAKTVKDIEFYSYLKDLASSNNLSLENFPDLKELFNYAYLCDSSDNTALAKEADALVKKCEAVYLAKADDAARLYKLSKNINLLIKMASLKLSPSEYSMLLEQKNSLLADDLGKDFLTQKASQFQLSANLPQNLGIIKNNLNEYFSFYETARKRNEAFVKNLIQKMDDKNVDVACLITGGFHSEELKDLINAQGAGYVAILPAVPEAGDDRIYLSVLKERTARKK